MDKVKLLRAEVRSGKARTNTETDEMADRTDLAARATQSSRCGAEVRERQRVSRFGNLEHCEDHLLAPRLASNPLPDHFELSYSFWRFASNPENLIA